MKQTEHYKLNKPDPTDYINVEDFNNNADIIDAELKKLSDVPAPSKEAVGLGNVDNVKQASKEEFDVLASSLDAHQADNAKHVTLPEKANWDGKYKKPNNGIPMQDLSEPIVTAFSDIGRFQASYGWEDTAFEGVLLNSEGKLALDDYGSEASRSPDNSSSVVNYKTGNVIKVNKNLKGVKVSLSDRLIGAKKIYICNLAGDVLKSQDIIGGTQEVYFDFVAGVEYRLLVDNNGSNYTYGTNASNASQFPILTTDVSIMRGSFASSDDTTRAYSVLSVQAILQPVQGTATRTVTAYELRKWGSVKFSKTTPSNTSVTCDVLSLGDLVLKSNIESMRDLSDIGITDGSIKLRFTLTRTTSNHASPSVSNLSVTWEGADYLKDEVTGAIYELVVSGGSLALREV